MNLEATGTLPFMIRCHGNPDLVLAAVDGQVVIEWIDLHSANQRWFWDSINGWFINEGAGGTMGVVDMAVGNRLLLHNQHISWQVTGGRIKQTGYPALDVTLDGENYSTGTAALLERSSQAPGQLWDVVVAATIQPPATRTIRLLAHSDLALCVDSGYYSLGSAGHQEVRNVFTLYTWSCGYGLYSEVTHEFLGTRGAYQRVTGYSRMCSQALWAIGSLEPNHWEEIYPWETRSDVLHMTSLSAGAAIEVRPISGSPDQRMWQVSAA